MQLKLGSHCIKLDYPQVMGVLNVTPDSFSDGGRFLHIDDALEQARRIAAEGAAIIDVGGVSTRPGAAFVPVQQELDRVIPVIERVSAEIDIPISVDTSHPDVMRGAVNAGAVFINDVYALRQDGALQAAAGLGTVVCLMHMLGEPATMQEQPQYAHFPGDIVDFLGERIEHCRDAGMDDANLVIDPGFGFGKTNRHNLCLLDDLAQFADFGLPVLVGLSRKRTLGVITGRPLMQRMPAGLAAALMAADRGANIVRTHDVGPTVDALAIRQAVLEAGRE